MLDLERIRSELPAIYGVRYFNTGGIGPMPRPVWAATTAELNRPLTASLDPMAWASELAERVPSLRARVARFFGADPEEIAFVRSVSEAYNIVLWGRSWVPEDIVLTTSEEHASGLMPLRNLQRRFGGVPEVRFVAIGPDVPATLERFESALGPQVRLIAVSQVTTDTGTVLPLRELTALAHRSGAEVLVDGAQSAGQLPIDLHELDVDYFAGIGSKWLMGPVGTGFLFLRRDRLPTLEVTWTGFTAEREYDDSSGAFELQADARKLEFGARHWPLYFGLGAALDYLDSVGMPTIVRSSRDAADRLRAALADIPAVRIIGPGDPAMQSSIVTFAIDGVQPEAVSAVLRNRYQVVQRVAPLAQGVRLCVGWFNTTEEIDAVIAAVAEIAASGPCR